MKETKLLSSVEFGRLLNSRTSDKTYWPNYVIDYQIKRHAYDNFLQTPLEPNQFIGEGAWFNDRWFIHKHKFVNWKQFNNYKTIEDIIKTQPTLTTSKSKDLGLTKE